MAWKGSETATARVPAGKRINITRAGTPRALQKTNTESSNVLLRCDAFPLPLEVYYCDPL
jgi:hypothetical protein